MDRITQKKKLSALDVNRYLPFDDSQNDATSETWETAVKNALAQLQHQQTRLENLELLGSYGASAYRVHNDQLEGMLAVIKGEGEEVRKSIKEVNRQRRYVQTDWGEELKRLEKKWQHLVMGNVQTELAIAVMEQELEQRRSYEQQLLREGNDDGVRR